VDIVQLAHLVDRRPCCRSRRRSEPVAGADSTADAAVPRGEPAATESELPRCCSAAKEEPDPLGAGQPQPVPRATCLEIALDCAFEQTALRELGCGPCS
jgi:hypothetical protein